jgi:periplasmic divalent cation tolerance protein
VPLLIKTTRAAYPSLEKSIREAHPYELPEIIAVPVTAGLPAYMDWVSKETTTLKE